MCDVASYPKLLTGGIKPNPAHPKESPIRLKNYWVVTVRARNAPRILPGRAFPGRRAELETNRSSVLPRQASMVKRLYCAQTGRRRAPRRLLRDRLAISGSRKGQYKYRYCTGPVLNRASVDGFGHKASLWTDVDFSRFRRHVSDIQRVRI